MLVLMLRFGNGSTSCWIVVRETLTDLVVSIDLALRLRSVPRSGTKARLAANVVGSGR